MNMYPDAFETLNRTDSKLELTRPWSLTLL
jgi:hypothetical protein